MTISSILTVVGFPTDSLRRASLSRSRSTSTSSSKPSSGSSSAGRGSVDLGMSGPKIIGDVNAVIDVALGHTFLVADGARIECPGDVHGLDVSLLNLVVTASGDLGERSVQPHRLGPIHGVEYEAVAV